MLSKEELLKDRYKVIAVIYKLSNTVSGNFYIGSTVQYNKRKVSHLSDLKRGNHHSQPLQRAFNKYGLDSFEFTILEEFEYINSYHSLQKEQQYIDKFKPEYNVCIVAGSPLGLKRSEEFKKGASARAMGKIAWNKGLTKESSSIIKALAEKHSKKMKGRKIGKRPPEVGKKVSEKRKGMRFSEEHKKNLSISQKKRNPETRNYSGFKNIKK